MCHAAPLHSKQGKMGTWLDSAIPTAQHNLEHPFDATALPMMERAVNEMQLPSFFFM